MGFALDTPEIAELLNNVLPLFQQPLPNSTAYARAQSLQSVEDAGANIEDLYNKLTIEASMIGLSFDSDFELPSRSARKYSRVLISICTVFERLLCNELKATIPNPSTCRTTISGFPKLVAIQNLIITPSGSLEDLDRSYPGGLIQFSNNIETNDKLMKLLNRCSDTLALMFLNPTTDQDPDLIEPDSNFKAIFQVFTSPTLRESTQALYQALRDKEPHWSSVGDKEAHNASIHISPFGSAKLRDGDEEFSIMLSTHSKPCLWQEGRVCVKQKRSRVRIADPHCTSPLFEKRGDIKNICEYIESYRQNRFRSYLLVEDDVLFKVRALDFPNAQDNMHNFGSEPTSLQSLIMMQAQLGGFEKKLLEIVIARIFLEVCEGPWLTQNWGKESFQFFPELNDKETIDLSKPYITADFQYEPNEDESDLFDISHSHPSILALGILLLEIEMGLAIETLWNPEDLIDGRPNVNTNHTTAKTLLKNKKWRQRICQPSRNAIQACLECKFLRADSKLIDEEWAQKVYNNVIVPLESELFACFPDQISEISCGSLLRIPENILVTRGKAADTLLIHKTEVPISKLDPSTIQLKGNPGSVSVGSASIRSGNFILFDDIIVSDHAKERLAKDWFLRFEGFSEAHLDPLFDLIEQKKHSYKRVRIAILDTGINEGHPVLNANSDRIVEKRSWVDDGNDMLDMFESGHGTHTAALVLQTAPLAHICVAKISKDRHLGKPEHIKEAIEWAVNDCKADIISMSFGFPVENTIVQPAIDYAFHQGKALFAATANDGGSGGVTYPANDPIVIGVNSSDGKGNRSDFSPTPRRNEDNFCTVGESVESFWPDLNGHWTPVAKSGTSYATPIAAGLAGSLLDYARLKMELGDAEINLLRRYKGMRAVFNLMKDKEPRDGYDFVAPWWLWRDGKPIERVHGEILEALRTA